MAQLIQPPQLPMDGSRLVQWLSVQAGNMAGDIQHTVRALMVRASSPMPVSDGHDEVSSFPKQLRHQQQTHRELQTMLQNHALAIETFQSKWQKAGQEAHAFIARTRAQSEDFVRAELTAVQRFEDSLQHQYDGQLRSHVNALQDECREHVGQEEDKMRKELQHAFTQKSSIRHDQQQQTLRQQACQEEYADAESTKEMNQLRCLIAEQADSEVKELGKSPNRARPQKLWSPEKGRDSSLKNSWLPSNQVPLGNGPQMSLLVVMELMMLFELPGKGATGVDVLTWGGDSRKKAWKPCLLFRKHGLLNSQDLPLHSKHPGLEPRGGLVVSPLSLTRFLGKMSFWQLTMSQLQRIPRVWSL